MKNTIRSLFLGLAALITFAHAAANDDPGVVAAVFGSALLQGDADTAISHMQIITPEESERRRTWTSSSARTGRRCPSPPMRR